MYHHILLESSNEIINLAKILFKWGPAMMKLDFLPDELNIWGG